MCYQVNITGVLDVILISWYSVWSSNNCHIHQISLLFEGILEVIKNQTIDQTKISSKNGTKTNSLHTAVRLAVETLRRNGGGIIYSPSVGVVEGIGVLPAWWRAIWLISFVRANYSFNMIQKDQNRIIVMFQDQGSQQTFPINKSFSFRFGMVKSWPKRIYHLWSPQLVSVTFIRPMTELRTKDPPFFAGIVCGTVCPKAKTGCSTTGSTWMVRLIGYL